MSRRYKVVIDEGDSGLDFEAILEVGMQECQAQDQGFNLIAIVEVTDGN